MRFCTAVNCMDGQVQIPVTRYQQETVSFRASATTATLRPLAMSSFHPHFLRGLS